MPEYHEQSDEEVSYAGDVEDHTEHSESEQEGKAADVPKATEKKKEPFRLSLEKTEDFNKKLRKRGVVYISRIPPRMTPTKIKSLLSDFCEVTRVYLAEEDPTARKRRKKNGGGGGKRYIEGWVEFSSKKMAKHIAQSLNNTPITNHKRNPHYGDLWNLKYLSKFKWDHLTEKVAYERRMREQKLRVEMMQARRENAEYVEMVESSKKLDKIEERKRKRGEKMDYKDGGRRRHKQVEAIDETSSKATKKAILASLV